MWKQATWIVAAVIGAGGAAAVDDPGAGKVGGPANAADLAAGLPEITREGNTVTLPLEADGPLAWRPIREGVKVAEVDVGAAGAAEKTEAKDSGVQVSYKRTRGQAAGAAMLVKPGTFAGLETLELTMTGTRAQRLSVCLKDRAGVVWTFPSVGLKEREPVQQSLRVADIQPDAYQNKGKVEAKFDPASVVMVTVLDIAGFMSAAEPDCEWRIESIKGVCR